MCIFYLCVCVCVFVCVCLWTSLSDVNKWMNEWNYTRWWWWRIKDLCQKWKVKLFFEATAGCPEPGLLSVWKSLTYGVIWNSLMAWSDWPWCPRFYDRSIRHCCVILLYRRMRVAADRNHRPSRVLRVIDIWQQTADSARSSKLFLQTVNRIHRRLLVLAPPTVETSGIFHDSRVRYPHIYGFGTENAEVRYI